MYKDFKIVLGVLWIDCTYFLEFLVTVTLVLKLSNDIGWETTTFYLTNREALTVLCSVIKHTGSG